MINHVLKTSLTCDYTRYLRLLTVNNLVVFGHQVGEKLNVAYSVL